MISISGKNCASVPPPPAPASCAHAMFAKMFTKSIASLYHKFHHHFRKGGINFNFLSFPQKRKSNILFLVILARQGGNPTYQCRRLRRKRRECAVILILRRQRRRELDGDFISPSFSRLRESTLLPFCYLRESANGDLSPKMANPCGGKAAGNFRRQRRR